MQSSQMFQEPRMHTNGHSHTSIFSRLQIASYRDWLSPCWMSHWLSKGKFQSKSMGTIQWFQREERKSIYSLTGKKKKHSNIRRAILTAEFWIQMLPAHLSDKYLLKMGGKTKTKTKNTFLKIQRSWRRSYGLLAAYFAQHGKVWTPKPCLQAHSNIT